MDVGRTIQNKGEIGITAIAGNGKWVEQGCPGAPQIWNIEHKSTEETTDQKWHVERVTIPSDDHSNLQTGEAGENQRIQTLIRWRKVEVDHATMKE